MNRDNILITGGYGCIGAQTVKWLIANTDANIVVGSRRIDENRSERVFDGVDRSRIRFVELDVREMAAIESVLVEHRINRVAHLAALQTPDCNANPDLGLQINLAGTQNLIEAMKRSGLPFERLVFASSIAVYGPRAEYPPGRVDSAARPHPVNVYGTWKLAGEQVSEFFYRDTGTPTLCLRPGVLFGPGRDAGLTSTPTTAMKQVALGVPYEIPFASRQDYLYAPDVGAAFGATLIEPFDGYGVFTLPSTTARSQDFADAMRTAATELGISDQFKITVGAGEVPFICDLEFQGFTNAFPNVPHTALPEAVRQSIQSFCGHVQRGWLRQS